MFSTCNRPLEFGKLCSYNGQKANFIISKSKHYDGRSTNERLQWKCFADTALKIPTNVSNLTDKAGTWTTTA